MRGAFPESEIVENRVDAYPIRVIVTAEVDGNAKQPVEVWSGRQQDLFSKYAERRENAMRGIHSSLEDLKKDFGL